MTITIEVPEDLARRLDKMPEGERPNFAIAAMRVQSEGEGEEPLDEATVTRMREGLSQLDSGDVMLWDDYMQQRRAARQQRP